MNSAERYDAALSIPFYRIMARRLDGIGWEYSNTAHDARSIIPLLVPLVEAYGETPVRLTITYCEPLIYSVPTTSLHKYGPAGEWETRRRASA